MGCRIIDDWILQPVLSPDNGAPTTLVCSSFTAFQVQMNLTFMRYHNAVARRNFCAGKCNSQTIGFMNCHHISISVAYFWTEPYVTYFKEGKTHFENKAR